MTTIQRLAEHWGLKWLESIAKFTGWSWNADENIRESVTDSGHTERVGHSITVSELNGVRRMSCRCGWAETPSKDSETRFAMAHLWGWL